MYKHHVYSDELYHHGVKGMKWGVRKDAYGIGEKRTAVKTANKEYSKAFNKAYSFSNRHPITQYVKKSKNYEKSNALYKDANDKARAYNDAKSAYKQAKKDAKSYNKNLKEQYYNKASDIETRHEETVTRIMKSYGQMPASGTKKSRLTMSAKNLYRSELKAAWNIYAGEIDLAKADYQKNKVKTR